MRHRERCHPARRGRPCGRAAARRARPARQPHQRGQGRPGRAALVRLHVAHPDAGCGVALLPGGRRPAHGGRGDDRGQRARLGPRPGPDVPHRLDDPADRRPPLRRGDRGGGRPSGLREGRSGRRPPRRPHARRRRLRLALPVRRRRHPPLRPGRDAHDDRAPPGGARDERGVRWTGPLDAVRHDLAAQARRGRAGRPTAGRRPPRGRPGRPGPRSRNGQSGGRGRRARRRRRRPEVARFDGDVVLVTGGARGIGRATVERFAGEGARVAFCDVDEDVGAHAAAAIGHDVRSYRCDVGVEDEVAELVRCARPSSVRRPCSSTTPG